MTHQPRTWDGDGLPVLPADEIDLPRLEAFIAAHPDIVVGRDARTLWQARLPGGDGQVITRHWLGQLLDTLKRALNGERVWS
ncbi:MAG TPA: hypothetical protein VF070_13240 [Streptosporangiaceae bacterium]